jgi:hypothetical protein
MIESVWGMGKCIDSRVARLGKRFWCVVNGRKKVRWRTCAWWREIFVGLAWTDYKAMRWCR